MQDFNKYKYCESLTSYKRFKTRVVKIGDLPIGGDFPIRIQSMTTTNTMDTLTTVEQTIRMYEAGCEYVRITAPSLNEAKNLQNIKDELVKRGYNIPLIADIHFTPNAAEVAAGIVEKVRVNPGNYVDKKKFQQIEYTDKEYDEEIQRIKERFTPLVKICKEHGTALRIGTNHGSLSDRIMSRYGDTPLGMVESALEFVRICQAENFHEIVLSMKASNVKIMVQAYRLLVNKMIDEGMDYPLHLGVTEAGDGEDGRIKSAVGIGALLEDGIGDTVRVSLTEEPENEVPVAIELVSRYKKRETHERIPEINELPYNPFEYLKRSSVSVGNIGGSNVPVVISDFSSIEKTTLTSLKEIGYEYNEELDKWKIADISADFIYLGKNEPGIDFPQNLKFIIDSEKWNKASTPYNHFPLFSFESYLSSVEKSEEMNFVSATLNEILMNDLSFLKEDSPVVLLLETENQHSAAELRRAFIELSVKSVHNPVVIRHQYKNITEVQFTLFASTDVGSLFVDGFGDGVWLSAPDANNSKIINTSFGILQATRTRISKTEYIACPSCGRTLFDLVEVTNNIRQRTGHLKGVKIGIMGCIVNGPGEMADADYGYVGSGVGKITLYRGQNVVKRNVSSENAVNELVNIIKDDGNWIEKD